MSLSKTQGPFFIACGVYIAGVNAVPIRQVTHNDLNGLLGPGLCLLTGSKRTNQNGKHDKDLKQGFGFHCDILLIKIKLDETKLQKAKIVLDNLVAPPVCF
jgi:hypothetical protein